MIALTYLVIIAEHVEEKYTHPFSLMYAEIEDAHLSHFLSLSVFTASSTYSILRGLAVSGIGAEHVGAH